MRAMSTSDQFLEMRDQKGEQYDKCIIPPEYFTGSCHGPRKKEAVVTFITQEGITDRIVRAQHIQTLIERKRGNILFHIQYPGIDRLNKIVRMAFRLETGTMFLDDLPKELLEMVDSLSENII